MNVCHDGDLKLRLDLPEHLDALFHAGTAKTVERRSVRLVKGCLEHVWHSQTATDFLDGTSYVKAPIQAFQGTGPSQEHQGLIPANRKAANLYLVHIDASPSSFLYNSLTLFRSSSVSTPTNCRSVLMTLMR